MQPMSELWVAYQDEASGFWIPEENAPAVNQASKTVSVVTSHFSKRVILKNRPTAGAWTSSFLDAMFGPFPAQCVPLGTPGLIPNGKVAFLFDASGSMGFENRNEKAVAIARQMAGGLRPIDEPGVYWLDETGPNGNMWGSEPWTLSALGSRMGDASAAFGGLKAFRDPKTNLRDLLTYTEQDLASPADVLREIVLFTDDEGLGELFATDSISSLLDPDSPTNQGTLSTRGIRLTVVSWPTTGGRPARWIDQSNQYVRVVTPTSTTGRELASELRSRVNRLADTGADPDNDGLTTCEELALFFPNPNFPGGSTRNPTNAPSVFFSQTKPTVLDSDLDGTTDGAEISRRKISSSPVLNRAFANLVAQGVDTYFVALTGRPDSADTDGDTLPDPAAGKSFETCLSGEPSPLTADSDGDGVNDAAECAQGTNPNLGQLTLRANPWVADYGTAQRQLDAIQEWKGAKVATGFATFTSSPALARFGRVRLTGFIPQDQTASTPCVNNTRLVQNPVGNLSPEECTGYLGDFREYATSYEDHRVNYLPHSRYIFDFDFSTGVWGLLVHPTCDRGPNGACHNAFPVATGDLTGFFKRRIIDLVGGQRKQLADIRSSGTVVSVQAKVVQSDSGLDSDPLRPAADFLATFELLTPSSVKVHLSADGFPAAEAFWIPKHGALQNLFNSSFAVKTAPSPFGMVTCEFDVLSSIFTGCNPLDYKVRTSQGCVALSYEVDGFLNLNG